MAGIKKHMGLVLLLSFSLVNLCLSWNIYEFNMQISKSSTTFFSVVENVADFTCMKMRYVESEVDDL